jgi:hypothetical protein
VLFDPGRVAFNRSTVLLLCLLWSPRLLAEIRFGDSTSCLDGVQLRAQLEALLSRSPQLPPGGLHIHIRGEPAGRNTTALTLRVVSPAGAIVLERHYRLTRGDCGTSSGLILLVLERFLTSFPVERWSAPPAVRQPAPSSFTARRSFPPNPAGAPVRVLELLFHAALSGELAPLGALAELGGDLALGSVRHNLLLSLSGAVGLPRALGAGHFIHSTILLGAGWRISLQRWHGRLEWRLGALCVTGYGYEKDYTSWHLWAEGLLSWERRWRTLSLGLEVAVAPLGYAAVTEDRQSSRDLAVVRAGLRLAIPLWSKNW